jgi:hypothetical protein
MAIHAFRMTLAPHTVKELLEMHFSTNNSKGLMAYRTFLLISDNLLVVVTLK